MTRAALPTGKEAKVWIGKETGWAPFKVLLLTFFSNSRLSHECYMSSSSLNHFNNILPRAQIKNVIIMQLFPVFCYLLQQYDLSSTLFLEIFNVLRSK
jgi:hypothetical protein